MDNIVPFPLFGDPAAAGKFRGAQHMPEAVYRELRYCQGAGTCQRIEGQVGRAQDEAVARGWMTPAAPGWYELTAAGRAALARERRP